MKVSFNFMDKNGNIEDREEKIVDMEAGQVSALLNTQEVVYPGEDLESDPVRAVVEASQLNMCLEEPVLSVLLRRVK